MPAFLAFLPRSRAELKAAVGACLKLSPKGYCSDGPHGPIGKWDVSKITDMSRMFSYATLFRADISKWDVSNVRNMFGMFHHARSFNGDISEWDVSRVKHMDYMFSHATLFSQKFCTASWVHSQATKVAMFSGSSASTSPTVCTTTPSFSPQSKAELKSAINACTLKLSPNSDNSDVSNGVDTTKQIKTWFNI